MLALGLRQMSVCPGIRGKGLVEAGLRPWCSPKSGLVRRSRSVRVGGAALQSFFSTSNDPFGVEVAHSAGFDVVEALLNRHTQVGKLLRLKRALVASVAQGLADKLAAGGVLARLDGTADGLGYLGLQMSGAAQSRNVRLVG